MTLDEQIEQVQQDIVLLETETPVNPDAVRAAQTLHAKLVARKEIGDED